MFKFNPSYLSLVISAAILGGQVQAAPLTEDQAKLLPYLKQPKEAIGLTDSIAARYNGKGVVVGVVDSGFFNQHPLLKNKRDIIPVPFTLTLNGKPYTFDPRILAKEKDQKSGKLVYDNHGGQVSGIIVADTQKSEQNPQLDYFGGIAKSATLYQTSYAATRDPIADSGDKQDDKKLLLGKSPLSRTLFAGAINNMIDKAPTLHVMNHSWNEDPVSDHAAEMDREYKGKLDLSNVLINSLQRATEKGILQVFAAGNESKRQPGILAALPRYFPQMEKHYLSVIAVGADHKLESYSNHCGVSKNWCIAAPGSMVLLAAKGDPQAGTVDYTFTIEQGTSYAAPTVSGVAALLKQRFDYMSMAQIRDVMLTTATDLGKKGVDDTFGWGMVNVGKALNGPAQLLGDESYSLNRDDRWSNSLSAGGRLTKRGAARLTLGGDSNRLTGITVAAGGLTLQGDTRLTENARVEQGNLRVDKRLQSNGVQIKPRASLSGRGVIDAATDISGLLLAEGMRFLQPLTLADTALVALQAPQGIIADGKAAKVRLGGRVSAAGLNITQAQAGQTAAQVLQLENGASYSGGFSALLQPQALLTQGLRYDLLFAPTAVVLNVNPATLTTTSANRNEAAAIHALNQLRDSRLAFSRSSYNQWLNRTLQSGDWQGLPANLGNSIYANGISHLLDQAALNRTLLHRQLSVAATLKNGEWQVWTENGRDNSRYHANQHGTAVKYKTKQRTLGVNKMLSERALLTLALADNRFDVTQANASADMRETRFSTGGRYYLGSAQDWFVEGDLSLAKIHYKQQRHFNGVAATAKGKTHGWNGNIGLSAGYVWQQNAWSLQPTIGIQLNHLKLKGFNEHDSELALRNDAVRQSEANALLELKLDRTLRYADWQFVPSVAIAYIRHLTSRPQEVSSRLDSVTIAQTATAGQRDHLRTQLALAVNYHAWQATFGWQHNGYKQEKGNKAYLNIAYRF
ncbi:Subtilisin-like serine proteases [Pasteurella testudinis DSM 23072]|uniref:Subtilisin-like serine proteases n=1 Tax=Pasteurella testudinis DSM 23072 TaxID=1122938 RepID=A0A1W1V2V7_9PAST|nr:S8 family serine peptidase [Pasteurella testudinis]SMB87620.1 Subtilisin-like serine proteases [Pasteurella testudinis DSM 23072]SUB50491.1 Serotype-specific antigen 1 precursor [Pasteurella testudinis]